MAQFTIALHHLRFVAGHGVYKEELSTGNAFEVNLSLKAKAPKEKITKLEQTINYAEVYRLTKELFLAPKPLLETLATEIADKLKEAFPALKKITVQIIKLNPPIASFTGSVSVTYEKKYI